MSTPTPTPAAESAPEPTLDPTMAAIATALATAPADPGAARAALHTLWTEIGVTGDALHRCTLAHHLADLHDDPAEALAWDVRALDAADALTQERLDRHHPGLARDAFRPSLHLNLADNYRRLGAFEAAAAQLTEARRYAPSLPPGAYGNLLRTAIDEVTRAVTHRDTARRASAPNPSG
ncbi:tetratricopeptide repeat protein [Streptomyces sp. NPDC093252]|uniref:tetratricopeptide repeat protein n=1 Tax=Streptomyces sp. NPDC093252 TaxID=3154980 RepID=UPI00343B3945